MMRERAKEAWAQAREAEARAVVQADASKAAWAMWVEAKEEAKAEARAEAKARDWAWANAWYQAKEAEARAKKAEVAWMEIMEISRNK